MTPGRGTAALALALAVLLATGDAAGSPPPRWVQEALERPSPPGTGEAAAVVLHDEERVVLHPFSRHETTTRHAVRVLRADGAHFARAILAYTRGSSECTWLRTWTVDAGGRVRRSRALRDAADVAALKAGQLFSDLRLLVAEADDIRPGEVFAYEAVLECDPLFAQWEWVFQKDVPVAFSRFTIDPSGPVEVFARTFGPDSATLVREGDAWTWEAVALAAIRNEPMSPGRTPRTSGVRVDVRPREPGRAGIGVSFERWDEASRWVARIAEPAGRATPVTAARAGELARGAADTLGRVRRLARFVQGINYVARSERTGIGWGYRPHEAGEVLALGYGDCKDKANLFAVLLRSLGVDAWLLAVNASDRDAVDTAWVTLRPFDHCITAFRPPAGFDGPTLDAGSLGRLAAFDATDPITALGDLPIGQQGSRGLLVAHEGGTLVRLPVLPESARVHERRIDAVLDSTGTLHARLREKSTGQSARPERANRRSRTAVDYRRFVEAWLPPPGATVTVRSMETRDDSTGGDFELLVEYDARSFARLHRDGTLTFRTTVAGRPTEWLPPGGPRESPIALHAEAFIETLSVRMPPGFVVEETPSDVRIVSELGRFEATWEDRDGVLVQTRRWELRPVTAGPERWEDVQALFAARRASGEQGVVLSRR